MLPTLCLWALPAVLHFRSNFKILRKPLHLYTTWKSMLLIQILKGLGIKHKKTHKNSLKCFLHVYCCNQLNRLCFRSTVRKCRQKERIHEQHSFKMCIVLHTVMSPNIFGQIRNIKNGHLYSPHVPAHIPHIKFSR